MADVRIPSTSVDSLPAESRYDPQANGTESKNELDTLRNDPNDEDISLTARDIFNFWDAVTHCAEPANYKEITKMLKDAVEEEDQASVPEQAAENVATDMTPPTKTPNEYELEFQNDRYQISWTDEAAPERHPAWPSEFCLVLTKEEGQDPFFRVFRTKLDSLMIDSQDPERTSQAYPELKSSPPRLVYQFGRRYCYGPSALEEDGTPKIGFYPQMDKYNYAEHAILGNRLQLRFSENEVVQAGDRKLHLENGNELTYGQINGLGGDFFATNNPICTGQTFDQQCEYFIVAYNLLGKAESGFKEAPLIDSINSKEMQAVRDAISTGGSTKTAYKDLAKSDPGNISSSLSGTDERLTEATMERDGPSYLRMALLNLDHFGQDAHKAYNAGHTCAMRAAAAGNLELGYAMNAFADHYLGDCFASGHMRTPRGKLHASTEAIARVCAIVNEIYETLYRGTDAKSRTESILNGGKKALIAPLLVAKLVSHASDVKAVAPDTCSKFMHDEDNKRGLLVANERGDQWVAYGDTMLFEPANAVNAKYMLQALQASADEVYQAYSTKHVPSDVNSFAAWRIAPVRVVEEHSHRPLFRGDGWYREDINDPFCDRYVDPASWMPKNWWNPLSISRDYPRLLVALNGSEYFRNL